MRKPQQTTFFPDGWSFAYFMHPEQSIAKLLEHIHDAGGEAEQANAQQTEDWRLKISTFADKLITPLVIRPSSTSNVIFKIKLSNTPVGYRLGATRTTCLPARSFTIFNATVRLTALIHRRRFSTSIQAGRSGEFVTRTLQEALRMYG